MESNAPFDNATFDKATFDNETFDNKTFDNQTESLENLNARFALALLPLTVIFGLFIVFGFFGNLLILLVFTLTRDYNRNNFKIFVLTLGVIDIIICITLIPAEMVKQRHYFAFDDLIMCKVKCFFNVFGASASCMALLVISIDRYRKVVQPFRKQLTPRLAIRILCVAAFVFPALLAVPGAIMCGIQKINKTNINGGMTAIYLCETEDRYASSIWRLIYKYSFVMLFLVISLVCIILYTFVMKEAAKQIRAIAKQKRNSSFEAISSSDSYDPNSVVKRNDSNCRQSSKTSFDENLTTNGSMTRDTASRDDTMSIKSTKIKKVSNQLSFKSLRSQIPLLQQRQGFPKKTLVWFSLTIVFIVSYMTHIILSTRVSAVKWMTPHQFANFSFFFRIYFVNHMINPVVYAIFIKRFRISCRKLLPMIKTRCFS